MKKYNLVPVVLCGGNGSRLWPLSRGLYPKQFLSFDGKSTMLEKTLERLDGLESDEPFIICNEEHRFIVAEQLRSKGKLRNNILLEPVGKNTAPAIALTAMYHQGNSNTLLLVLPADHLINNKIEFQETINKAIPYAKRGKLVTFGITPSKAETGYGYIKCGENISDDATTHCYQVDEFVEKPNLVTANKYLDSGRYYWNSGMFLFDAKKYLGELKKFRPDIYDACNESIVNKSVDLDFIRINEESFKLCPSESIDYAVMEHTSDAVVIPMSAEWSDVGSWATLWELSPKDEDNNVISGDVISLSSTNNYIYSESSLVTTIDVHNLVIIQTKDAILISDLSAAQDVKKIVDIIKSKGRNEHHTHLEMFRPWGRYSAIDSGVRYQVKRITIKPGEGMSLQLHHHRAEHWIVLSGTAQVTINESEKILTENESVDIPVGVKHSIYNPGKIPLEVIEVRSGSYLEEDDIVRFSDRYGRL